jgi:hypothetical protein
MGSAGKFSSARESRSAQQKELNPRVQTLFVLLAIAGALMTTPQYARLMAQTLQFKNAVPVKPAAAVTVSPKFVGKLLMFLMQEAASIAPQSMTLEVFQINLQSSTFHEQNRNLSLFRKRA